MPKKTFSQKAMIETESKFADKINTGGLQVYIKAMSQHCDQLICQESVKNTFVCFNCVQFIKKRKKICFEPTFTHI